MKKLALFITALALALAMGVAAQAAAPTGNKWNSQPAEHAYVFRAAGAQPVVVVDVLGRAGRTINHFGNPALGSVFCTAQGLGVDSTDNGLADLLQGRAACLENSHVIRIRIETTKVQVNFADVWTNVPPLVQTDDVVSNAQPAYAVAFTNFSNRCPFPAGHIRLTYRTVQTVAIRWSDDTVGRHVVKSDDYQFLAVHGTQLC